MICGKHQDQPLSLVHGIEKSVITYTIPPGFRDGIPKFLDVLADVGVDSKLGIDVCGELVVNASLLPTEILLEVFLELRGLEDAKVSQRACPCAV